MKILKVLILFVFSTFFVFQSYGQDPAFSQYFANPLYLNPAFAGIDGKNVNVILGIKGTINCVWNN